MSGKFIEITSSKRHDITIVSQKLSKIQISSTFAGDCDCYISTKFQPSTSLSLGKISSLHESHSIKETHSEVMTSKLHQIWSSRLNSL